MRIISEDGEFCLIGDEFFEHLARKTSTKDKEVIGYGTFFNVSLDYIFGRCDEPHGQLYDAQPKPLEDTQLSSFLSMCFDPSSSANAKLKEAVRRILQEETANREITNGETENEC